MQDQKLSKKVWGACENEYGLENLSVFVVVQMKV
jgi:hypothetical protein